jgi:hypothetical protein
MSKKFKRNLGQYFKELLQKFQSHPAMCFHPQRQHILIEHKFGIMDRGKFFTSHPQSIKATLGLLEKKRHVFTSHGLRGLNHIIVTDNPACTSPNDVSHGIIIDSRWIPL